MENRGYEPHEVIELGSPRQTNNAPPTRAICAVRSTSDSKDSNGNNSHQHYCDVRKCCAKNEPVKSNESPWHSTKSTFLLVFLVGFLVWAVCFFGLFRNSMT